MQKEQFLQQLADNGYLEPREKFYEPDSPILRTEMHTHEFSAMVMVTEGEFEITREDGATRYGPGEWCEVPAGTLHAEKTGPEGAKVLAGRKS